MAADSALPWATLRASRVELSGKTACGRKGLYDVEVDAHARVLGKTLREEEKGGHEIPAGRRPAKAAWDAFGGEAGLHCRQVEPDSGKLRALVTSLRLRQQPVCRRHLAARLGRPAHQQPFPASEPRDPKRVPPARYGSL